MSFEKLMKVFSPDGRIYQLEYAFKAIHTFGQTSVAIRGTDSVVVCTQKKVPDKLIVPDSVSNIYSIADTVGCVIVGNMNDARFMVVWLRSTFAEYKMKFGYEMPLHVLAKELGHHLQKYSQQAYMRPFCVSITLVGIDEESGPTVYKIDPAGNATGFRAVAMGSKEQEATTHLEKQWKKNEGQWNQKEAISTAISTLQTVISSDFKSNEIEVGIATQSHQKFRKLTELEIEAYLNELADKQ
jgi:20S proteasome subunit alpha 1